MDDVSSDADSFDTEHAVATYRGVALLRDAEPSTRGKAGFQSTLNEMRARWMSWYGKDSLHRLAFGEPDVAHPLQHSEQ